MYFNIFKELQGKWSLFELLLDCMYVAYDNTKCLLKKCPIWCVEHDLKILMNSICLRLIILRNICITACVKKSFYTFILLYFQWISVIVLVEVRQNEVNQSATENKLLPFIKKLVKNRYEFSGILCSIFKLCVLHCLCMLYSVNEKKKPLCICILTKIKNSLYICTLDDNLFFLSFYFYFVKLLIALRTVRYDDIYRIMIWKHL